MRLSLHIFSHADGSASRDFLLATAKPILEWWSGRRISEVNKTNCRAYVKSRTSRFGSSSSQFQEATCRGVAKDTRRDLKSPAAALNWYKSEHDGRNDRCRRLTLPKKAPPRKDYWLSSLRLHGPSSSPGGACRPATSPACSGSTRERAKALAGCRRPQRVIDLESGTLHRAARQNANPTSVSRLLAFTAGRPHLRRWHRLDSELGITHVAHYMGAPIHKLRRAWASVGGGKDGPLCATPLRRGSSCRLASMLSRPLAISE